VLEEVRFKGMVNEIGKVMVTETFGNSGDDL